eukprot:TRINITY_DN6726_c0_g1_i2.p1 TRINITY_DN6726_c0_g1~~TRINITY_DN6726_c0_g1_i2.p1  ORF type:complete len:119 (+),score=16.95 TRINITY_DN6726_c0_g1_i2:25-381(+)
MEKMRLIGILLMALLFIGGVKCLECYECQDEECLEEDLKPTTCDDDSQFCTKVQLNGEMTRSCAYDEPPSGGTGCTSLGDTEICYCQGDLCNGAMSSVSVSFLTALSSILTITLAYTR